MNGHLVRAAPLLTPRNAWRLRLVPAMARDAVSGRWTGPGRRRLARCALGLVYLLSPVDAVPEALLPLLGLADDGVVAVFVAGQLRSAAADYDDWRARRPSVHRRRRR